MTEEQPSVRSPYARIASQDRAVVVELVVASSPRAAMYNRDMRRDGREDEWKGPPGGFKREWPEQRCVSCLNCAHCLCLTSEQL